MVRLALGTLALVTLVVAAVGLAVTDPADAQDRTEDRISALETQVAELSGRVARLEAQAAATPLATPLVIVPTTFTITGDLLLRQPLPGVMQQIGPCLGIDGYDDIHGGAPVVVRDEANAIIATGSLGEGEWVEAPNASEIAALDWNCRFPIVVEDVPRRDFYTVEVSHRGGLTYSFAEMEAANWQVHLVLGNND